MYQLKRKQIAGMNLSYKMFSFDYFLDSMNRIGFESIELYGASPHFYVPDLTAADVAAFSKKIRSRGLSLVCYTPEQCSYPENIAAPCPVARKRSVAAYQKTIQVGADLGSPLILMTSGWGDFDEDPAEAWKRSADSLAQLAKTAEESGIIIVLEPLRVEETNVVSSLQDAKRMVDEVNSPALKVMLDTSPMYNHGETIEDYFAAFGEDMRHIHFIDGDPAGHLVWGEGIFPLQDYLAQLTARQYTGALTLELTASKYYTDPHTSMEAAFRYLAPYFAE